MKPEYRHHRLHRGTIVRAILNAMLITGVAWAVVEFIQGAVYDEFSYVRFLDLSYQIRGFDDPDPRICLVQVDRLPASRTDLARALDRVKPYHPRAIGIDLFLDSLRHDRGDSLLHSALAGDVPIALACETRNGRLVPPDPFFLLPNVHLSHANLRSSGRDGIVRRFGAGRESSNAVPASFAMELARLEGSGSEMPFASGKEYLINYAGDYERFKNTSIREILGPDTTAFWRLLVPGNILVFGYYATANDRYPVYEDVHRTPFHQEGGRFTDGRAYGVEVHANILHTILSGRQIRESGQMPGLALAVIVCAVNFIGHAVFARMSFAERRRLFQVIYGIELTLIAAGPVVLFFLIDYALDLTIPLIALFIFPRAQALYYTYVDNVTIAFRRYYLRGCPGPLLEQYAGVYKASSLADRFAAAVHATGSAIAFASWVMNPQEAKRRGRSGDETLLREELEAARQVYRRSGSYIDMRHAIRQLYARARTLECGSTIPSSEGEGVFTTKASHLSVLIAPRVEDEHQYEDFFLELMDALNALLAALRPHFGDPAGVPWFAGAEQGPASGQVRHTRCIVHDRDEYFVAMPYSGTPGKSVPFGGSFPECCFPEPDAHEE